MYGSPWGRKRDPSDPAYLDAGHSGVASIRGHYQAEWERWEGLSNAETDRVGFSDVAERALQQLACSSALSLDFAPCRSGDHVRLSS